MEEFITNLKSRGMKREGVDEMWKEMSKRECEENRSYRVEEMVMEDEVAVEVAMADKWQELTWGTNAPWASFSVPSSMLDET